MESSAAEDEDAPVMYLVVRASLGMSPGKLAAQVGHAVQVTCLRYPDSVGLQKEHFERWLRAQYPKVVLRASDAEFDAVKAVYPDSNVVVDSGRTELVPGTETVVGFWPMPKGLRTKALKRLRVLEARDLGLGPLQAGDPAGAGE